jgi:hypothetical protein
MNTKRNLATLALTACIALFASGHTLFGQTAATTPSPTAAMQTQGMNQMPGMDSNSDSMKQMAEMCMRMMQSEKAAMPYIIGVSVLFGLLLFIALVLLIVLEIQWIKYWSRVLKRTAVE